MVGGAHDEALEARVEQEVVAIVVHGEDAVRGAEPPLLPGVVSDRAERLPGILGSAAAAIRRGGEVKLRERRPARARTARGVHPLPRPGALVGQPGEGDVERRAEIPVPHADEEGDAPRRVTDRVAARR
jgi:hypothetical protein